MNPILLFCIILLVPLADVGAASPGSRMDARSGRTELELRRFPDESAADADAPDLNDRFVSWFGPALSEVGAVQDLASLPELDAADRYLAALQKELARVQTTLPGLNPKIAGLALRQVEERRVGLGIAAAKKFGTDEAAKFLARRAAEAGGEEAPAVVALPPAPGSLADHGDRRVELQLKPARTRDDSAAPRMFTSVAAEARREFRQVSKKTKADATVNLRWDGPSLPRILGASNLEFNDKLSWHHLNYSYEDQGRDNLDEILAVFLQVGIGQGRRRFVHGANFERAKAELREALVSAQNGDLEEAVQHSKAASDLADWIALGINPLSERSRYGFSQATRRAKKDWPANGDPANEDEIVDSMAKLIKDAYGLPRTPELDAALRSILDLGIDQGRRIAADEFKKGKSVYLSMVDMTSKHDLLSAAWARESYISSLKKAHHELHAEQLDEYSFKVPEFEVAAPAVPAEPAGIALEKLVPAPAPRRRRAPVRDAYRRSFEEPFPKGIVKDEYFLRNYIPALDRKAAAALIEGADIRGRYEKLVALLEKGPLTLSDGTTVSLGFKPLSRVEASLGRKQDKTQRILIAKDGKTTVVHLGSSILTVTPSEEGRLDMEYRYPRTSKFLPPSLQDGLEGETVAEQLHARFLRGGANVGAAKIVAQAFDDVFNEGKRRDQNAAIVAANTRNRVRFSGEFIRRAGWTAKYREIARLVKKLGPQSFGDDDARASIKTSFSRDEMHALPGEARPLIQGQGNLLVVKENAGSVTHVIRLAPLAKGTVSIFVATDKERPFDIVVPADGAVSMPAFAPYYLSTISFDIDMMLDALRETAAEKKR